MTSRRIGLDDMRIHYLEWGDAGAPPLVLLHGIARCAHAFDHLAPHFAPERPKEISNRRASRMGVEENGWASREELLAKVRTDNPRWLEPVARNLVEHAAREREDGRVVWKRDPAILKGFVPTELWDTVKKIRAPIVYILGGASTIVPQHTQDELKAALPQAEIVSMPGLGHYPSDEDPGAFLAIVDRFLAKI
jgi:pimeloyl-ACP methyl ester carboxylesterase